MPSLEETIDAIKNHLAPFYPWGADAISDYATAVHTHIQRIPAHRFVEICKRLASEFDPSAKYQRKLAPAAYWAVNRLLEDKNDGQPKECKSCGGTGGRMWCAWNPGRWPREGEPLPDYSDVLAQETEPCNCDQSPQAQRWRQSAARATNQHGWEVIDFAEWGAKLREFNEARKRYASEKINEARRTKKESTK